ncbi:MAG TPA: redox-sensing transcriptional repressor Rex [Actinomycetota bacterium]|nr:redox-sensing transcriptional repressor Rex [Actinomycetota bacterium]
MRERAIPEATVARLPLYLRSLYDMTERGLHTVSSEGLAEAAGVNSAKVRKDLSYLGSYGTRGVGYDVEYLIYQISRELGLTQDWNCVIVGVGNLGRALANYRGFGQRGFRVMSLVDVDESKIGQQVDAMTVEDFNELERIVKEREVSIGIIATTAAAAQEAADRLVSAGVKSILNFAPTVLQVPDDVSLRKVDLSIELQILSFYEQRKTALDHVRRGKRLTASASKSTRP